MIQYLRKNIGNRLVVGAFLFLAVASSDSARAATAYLKSDYTTLAVGDAILVSVVMDTDGKNPNTIDGEVLLKESTDSLEITDFSLADSVLTTWLKKPSFEDESKISFAGGVPGGFNQKDAVLFRIVFLAKAPGQITLMPSDMKAFDNDGKATTMNVSNTPITITVGPPGTAPVKNQWRDIVSTDNEPPQDLTVAIGRDDAVFEGKKFMTISAVDKQSGIDYFEVAEGSQPAFRTGGTYVLLDQSESTPLLVTVYDKAGNKKSILLHPDATWDYRWFILVAAMLCIAGFVFQKRFGFKRFLLSIRKKKNV